MNSFADDFDAFLITLTRSVLSRIIFFFNSQNL